MKKNKECIIIKIIIALIMFICFDINVYADMYASSCNKYTTDTECKGKVEDGVMCSWVFTNDVVIENGKAKFVEKCTGTGCADGYQLSGNKCVPKACYKMSKKNGGNETKCNNAPANCGYKKSNGDCYDFSKFQYKQSCADNGYFWDGTACKKDLNSKCATGYKLKSGSTNICIKGSSDTEIKQDNDDTSWCSGSNQYLYNGGCYEATPGNCKYHGVCNTEAACKGKCDEPTSSTGWCNGKDEYSYNGGCYTLDEYNCKHFGFEWTSNGCNKKSSGASTGGNVEIFINTMLGYMEGFACSSNTVETAPGSGICYANIPKGTQVSLPNNYKNLVIEGSGAIIGWTNDLDSTTNEPACVKGKVDESNKTNITVNSTTHLYACYRLYINQSRWTTPESDLGCGKELHITWCKRNLDNSEYCFYEENGTTQSILRNHLTDEDPTKINYCSSGDKTHTIIIEREPLDENEKCPSKKELRQTGAGTYHTFEMCYDADSKESEVKKDVISLVTCKSGYELDENSVVPHGDALCNSKICKIYYDMKCVKKNLSEPRLDVTAGFVESDGKGTVRVKASSPNGKVEYYYASETYKVPTSSNDWIKLDSESFSLRFEPGIKYIWVKDSENQISSGVSGVVLDTVNTNTTINSLKLVDANGNFQAPNSVMSYKTDKVTPEKYVRLSNQLSKDSVIAENGFNPFDMEYKLEVSSPTVTVYATLTSTDSKYVDGYEPRTVNLDYGINTVLIKIMNNEGKVRTYTILVTRTDDRTADNTLNDLSVSVGNINFNSNVTDYKIEIPKETKNVEVKAKIASDVASYIDGYEPGNVVITGDTTVKLIKVKSETGSTRTYVLTFVKEGTDIVSKKTLQLFDLNIPGVYVPFEEGVSNYSLTVDYANRVININAALMDENSSALYYVKRKGDSSYTLGSNKGINLDVGENFVEIKVTDKDGDVAYYRLTIIRKEFGLEVSNDTSLKDLKVLGYNIEFEPNKKEYTVRIKREKSLVITAVPNSNRSEVFIRGNEELTGFSTVRVKVVAENGEFETYSIDIKKDAFNKTIEIIAIVLGVVIIIGSSCIIVVNKKKRSNREYYEE